MALFYADSSALVKLIRAEPETPGLRAFLESADIVSCELVRAEVPRAVRRACALAEDLPLDALLERVGELLESLAMVRVDRAVLEVAGGLAEPSLRALDAIHVAGAVSALPLDGFISYDERQSAVARLAGLPTFAPGG